MKNKEPEEILIEKIREIFAQYGTEITPDEYDKIKFKGKPGRPTLRKYIGTWQVVRSLAIGETQNHTSYLKKLNEKLLKDLDRERNKNQIIIENCLGAISKCSFSPANIPPPEKVKYPQEFHALKSDDHVGEKVDPKWVQGVSEYDSGVFKERLHAWAHKIITFRDQDKTSLGLNKLVINFLGDIITGEQVYKGQSFFIEFSSVDQLFFAFGEYMQVILTLAQNFPQIEIYCTQGNHGRVGKKGESHPRTNMDYIFYRFLEYALRQQDNVKVYVSESPTMIVRHGDYNFALNHNDDTRGWNGIPYYGLDRKARRLGDLYGMTIHYKLGGHFHSPANLNDETLLNGTMMGGSDLSVNKMMVATIPSQKIFYFDRNHGIHRESNLYLADKPVLTADENGIYTAYTGGIVGK